jgi:diguanylate cyclase (GGDEF)-like protein/PAS domain S-box-containing protein
MPPVGIGIIDLEGHATMTDEVLRESLGYSREEFAAMPFTAYTHPEDLESSLGRFAQLVAGEIERYTVDRRFIRKDGAALWVALTVSLVRDAVGNPDHVIGVTQDITERKLLESDPRAEQQRARLQVERIPAIVYVAATGPTGGWLYVSPQIEVILGFTAQEWMADPGLWLQQLHPQDRETVVADEERALLAADEEDRTYSNTYRMRHRNGSTVWLRDDAMMLWDKDGRATFHGVLVDVTAQKLLEERLEHQAFHDPLTGLPNRKLFHDRVGHALSRRHTDQVAVLFIDLDNFKTVNDSFGHACGDEVIVATAHRLQTCARASDTAARLGGDEFALLLEDVNAAAVMALADRVLDALKERPVMFSGRALTIGASVGIAVAGKGETTETLLRNADLAMYEAKLQGRGRHVLYEPTMHATAITRFRLKEALQTAIADRAITLAYQPIVDLRTGAVVGIEALARWVDRQLGEVPPAEFIPLAEETGLIHELGRWAIEQACRDLTQWRATHGVQAYVSVNVSPLQLDNERFASSVVPILLNQGLEPSALTLEVTEGVPLVERSRESLRELRSHGVRVAIDDFGTGYSSLSYLRQLPVDMVKIDQTFLVPSEDSAAEPSFLRAIIRLAETLHLSTVCEGIETPDQLSDLQAAGCGYGQGNLLAKPGPLLDVPASIQVVPFTLLKRPSSR